jgi:hypothetical protein
VPGVTRRSAMMRCRSIRRSRVISVQPGGGADKETAAGRIAIGKAGGGCTEITLDRLIDRVNKEGLFRAAMERYVEKFSAWRDAALGNDALPVDQASA